MRLPSNCENGHLENAIDIPICIGIVSAHRRYRVSEQLKAQYKLARLSGASLDTAEGGTVLTIEKSGIRGSSGNLDLGALYRGRVLNAPTKFAVSLAQGMVEGTWGTAIDARPLAVWEKIYVYRTDASVKGEKITFSVVGCKACDGVTEGSPYESMVVFEFPKGYLETASVSQVRDTIAQVLAFDAGSDIQQAQPVQTGQTGEQGQATAGSPLTNDDVIRMAQAKLPDSVIIAKIKSSACAFDTSADALVKLKQAGVSDAVLQAVVQAGAAPAARPATPGIAPAQTASAPGCGDYKSCFDSGVSAEKASQLESALSYLQAASSKDPSKPDPFDWLGRVYLDAGQYQDFLAMWDKALELGGTLAFGAWHYKGLSCERGVFRLGAKEVSFALPGKQALFSAAPTELSSVKARLSGLILLGDEQPGWIFGMKAGGRNYSFAFGARACQGPGRCSDPAGYDQEKAVANYVAQTIEKLTLGSVGK